MAPTIGILLPKTAKGRCCLRASCGSERHDGGYFTEEYFEVNRVERLHLL